MLKVCKYSIIDAYLVMEDDYVNDGKLLIAGNSGSAADSEHIAGELISTPGNSKNVMSATVVARTIGLKIIGLTSAKGGELAEVADVGIKVTETETYMIQELHIPVYHCLCLMLEDRFFGEIK